MTLGAGFIEVLISRRSRWGARAVPSDEHARWREPCASAWLQECDGRPEIAQLFLVGVGPAGRGATELLAEPIVDAGAGQRAARAEYELLAEASTSVSCSSPRASSRRSSSGSKGGEQLGHRRFGERRVLQPLDVGERHELDGASDQRRHHRVLLGEPGVERGDLLLASGVWLATHRSDRVPPIPGQLFEKLKLMSEPSARRARTRTDREFELKCGNVNRAPGKIWASAFTISAATHRSVRSRHRAVTI